MKPTKVTRTRVKTSYKAEISREQLVELLPFDVPANAEIYVYVPGGGDWSNMSLSIDADTPIQISWTEKEEEKTDVEEAC